MTRCTAFALQPWPQLFLVHSRSGAERLLHLTMSADRSSHFNSEAREFVPAGSPEPKAKGKAARKIKAKFKRMPTIDDLPPAGTNIPAAVVFVEAHTPG